MFVLFGINVIVRLETSTKPKGGVGGNPSYLNGLNQTNYYLIIKLVYFCGCDPIHLIQSICFFLLLFHTYKMSLWSGRVEVKFRKKIYIYNKLNSKPTSITICVYVFNFPFYINNLNQKAYYNESPYKQPR